MEVVPRPCVVPGVAVKRLLVRSIASLSTMTYPFLAMALNGRRWFNDAVPKLLCLRRWVRTVEHKIASVPPPRT